MRGWGRWTLDEDFFLNYFGPSGCVLFDDTELRSEVDMYMIDMC